MSTDLDQVRNDFATLLVRCIEPTGIHQKLIKAAAQQLENLIDLKIEAAFAAKRARETSVRPPIVSPKIIETAQADLKHVMDKVPDAAPEDELPEQRPGKRPRVDEKDQAQTD